MKKLAFLLFLAASAAFGQSVPSDVPLYQADRRLDGGITLSLVDFSSVQTQGTYLAAPCPPAGDGPPTFRPPCATDGVTLNQATTPGSQQTGNINESGVILAGTNFETPTTGGYKVTGGGGLFPTGTLGQFVLSKSSGAALNGWLELQALHLQPQTADTSGPVTISSGDGIRRCDATSGAFTYTLPSLGTAANTGEIIGLIKTDSSANACTLTRASSNTFEGGNTANSTLILANQWDYVILWGPTTASASQWITLASNYKGNVTMTSVTQGAVRASSNQELTGTFSGATFATAANLVPANSRIDAIELRITTTLTGSGLTGFTVKVTGAANPYASIGTATTTLATVTANTTYVLVPNAHADAYTTSASTITFTPVGAASWTGGVCRVVVWYTSFTPPTS